MKNLKYLMLLFLLIPIKSFAFSKDTLNSELILYNDSREVYRIKNEKEKNISSFPFTNNFYDLYVPYVDLKENTEYRITFKFQRFKLTDNTDFLCMNETPNKKNINKVAILTDEGSGFKPKTIHNLEVEFDCFDGAFNQFDYFLTTKQAIKGKLYIQMGFDKKYTHNLYFSQTNVTGTFYYKFLYSEIGSIDEWKKFHDDEERKRRQEDEERKRKEEENKNIFEKIGDFLINLPNLIFNAIKSLFIPSEEFFKNFMKDIGDFFKNKLGFLYTPIDVVTKFFERIKSLSSGNSSIAIPEIRLPIFNQVLIPSQSVNLKANIQQVFGDSYNFYLTFIDFVLWVMFLKFASDRFTKFIRGGE